MDLNDLKNQTKNLRAPEIAMNGFDTPVRSLDDFVVRLKEQDEKDRRRYRRMKIFFVILAVVYTMLFTLTWIFPPDHPAGRSRFVLGLFSLICVVYGTLSALKLRGISKIDYSLPVGLFLKESERRYRFLNGRDIWFLALLFVIVTVTSGLAWMVGLDRYFPSLDKSTGLVAFVVFWAIVSLVSVVFGILEWKRNRAPILEDIRMLRRELTAG
jgi:hypothetical protein